MSLSFFLSFPLLLLLLCPPPHTLSPAYRCTDAYSRTLTHTHTHTFVCWLCIHIDSVDTPRRTAHSARAVTFVHVEPVELIRLLHSCSRITTPVLYCQLQSHTVTTPPQSHTGTSATEIIWPPCRSCSLMAPSAEFYGHCYALVQPYVYTQGVTGNWNTATLVQSVEHTHRRLLQLQPGYA